MYDSLLVRGGEPLRQLGSQAENFLSRKRTACQLAVQGDSRNVFRNQEINLVLGVEFVHRGNIGWFNFASTKASLRNRLRAVSSANMPAGRTLRATSRSRCSSRARSTTPIPPAPICSTRR